MLANREDRETGDRSPASQWPAPEGAHEQSDSREAERMHHLTRAREAGPLPVLDLERVVRTGDPLGAGPFDSTVTTLARN